MTEIYKCEFSPEQVRVILQALDIYSRIGAGQLDPIACLFIGEKRVDLEKLRESLIGAETAITGLPPHAYFGISCKEVPERYKVAYDMQQVIRHSQAWHENPTGSFTVNFDEPRKYATHELMKKPVVVEKDES